MEIIDKHQSMFITTNIGPQYLSQYERQSLKNAGVDLEKFKDSRGKIDEAFAFGLLSSAISDNRAKSMNYKEFKKFMYSKNYMPLTRKEEAAVDSLKHQITNDVRVLGGRIKGDVAKIITHEDLNLQSKLDTSIVEAGIKAVQMRGSVSDMISEIGHKTGAWDRDLGRIAEYVLHNAYEEGRASTLEREYGKDVFVYKDVYPGACKHCIAGYLTAGLGSKPRIFKLSELKSNGTNIGRKAADWKPTLGPLHPYCFSDDTEVLTDRGWRLFRDLTLKEKFLSINLDTGNSHWVAAVERVQYHYKGKMHSIQSRDFDSLTTPNHRHVVHFDGWSNNKLRLVEGTRLPRESKFLRTIPDYKGKDYKSCRVGGVEFNSEDWFTFMGWYISEGSCVHQGNERWEICITQLKSHYRQEIIDLCKRLFGKIWVGKEDIVIPINLRDGMYSKRFIDSFRSLGHSYQKYIPKYIKAGSTRLLQYFLISYCKGDGTFDKSTVFEGYTFKGQRHFHTSSDKLAADIGEILLKTGKKPSYTKMPSVVYEGYRCREVWKISEGNSKYTHRLNSKREDRLTEVDYDGMVYDVELEKYHTLVVRRKGRVWISGNCRCTVNEVPEGYEWSDEEGKFVRGTPTIKNQRVKDRSKVKVKIGDKDYLV